MIALAAIALVCAPNIHPTTLNALVSHESATNQYAIGINKGQKLDKQPTTLEAAKTIAKELVSKKVNFDAGLGQINVNNWAWLGLNTDNVFDACTNLKAAQTVLADCYKRALKVTERQQIALRKALSCYNTGNFKNGFTNGYVKKVLAQSDIKIPALQPIDQETNTASTDSTSTNQPTKKQTFGIPDGFTSNPINDGFSTQVEPKTF